MKFAKLFLVSVLVFGSGLLHAHTGLQTATPADGAVLNTAPSALELVFSGDVQLLKLDVSNAAGTAQDVAFTPVATAAKSFSVPLPALAPAAYTVKWTALGADGHRVEGSFGFTVDPAATESAGATAEHHDH